MNNLITNEHFDQGLKINLDQFYSKALISFAYYSSEKGDSSSSIYVGGILNSHHRDQHAKYYGKHCETERKYESAEILGRFIISTKLSEYYKGLTNQILAKLGWLHMNRLNATS